MQAFLEIFISNTGRSEISKLVGIKKAIKKKTNSNDSSSASYQISFLTSSINDIFFLTRKMRVSP